jgi:deoxyribose-phosphate aldolase
MSYTKEQIAAALDYAVLNPMANMENVTDGCSFANKHKLMSICVAPVNVSLAASYHPNVSTVIGYPLGNLDPLSKYQEAMNAIVAGAKELDVVVNYGRFLGGDQAIIYNELQPICVYARTRGVLVKAILETHYYTTRQLVDACLLCATAGVDFIKTSTGRVQGATKCAVRTILDTVGETVSVKASGGIKTYEDAKRFLDLGCTRLGSSSFTELLP